MPTNTENRVPQPLIPLESNATATPQLVVKPKVAVVQAEELEPEPTPVHTQGISDVEIADSKGKPAPNVVVRQSGLTAGSSSSKALAQQLGPKLCAQAQALMTGQGLTDPSSSSSMQSQWSSFVAQANSRLGGVIDVNGLVQFALEQAYMSNTADLEFYAEKVKFYNQLKQSIRAELTKARNEESAYAGQPDNTLLDPPYEEATFADAYFGPGSATAQSDTSAAAKAAKQAYAQALTQAESGGGVTQVSQAQAQSLKPPANGDVFVTAQGYRIDYNKASGELTVYGPPDASGKSTQLSHVWGDPHVTQEDGSNFNFANGSTFVLPDGTKISMSTKDVGNGTYGLVGIDILSGKNHASDSQTSDPKVANDRVNWDAANKDTEGGSSGGVFALESNGRWAELQSDGSFKDVKNASVTGSTQGISIETNGAATGITSAEAQAANDGNETGALAAGRQAAQYEATTVGDLKTYVSNLEDKLNSVGDDAQLANVDLQDTLQKQQATLQMVSNISKMLYDTATAVIRKIGS